MGVAGAHLGIVYKDPQMYTGSVGPAGLQTFFRKGQIRRNVRFGSKADFAFTPNAKRFRFCPKQRAQRRERVGPTLAVRGKKPTHRKLGQSVQRRTGFGNSTDSTHRSKSRPRDPRSGSVASPCFVPLFGREPERKRASRMGRYVQLRKSAHWMHLRSG